MNSKVLTVFVSEFDATQSTNGWWRFTNPFDVKSLKANDRTMAFSPTYNYVKCFRTGERYTAYEFLMRWWSADYQSMLEEVRGYRATDFIKVKNRFHSGVNISLKFPDHYVRLLNKSDMFAKRAQNYIKNRGFNLYRLDNLKFGYFEDGPYMGYIFIPYWSHGELVYWSARSFMDHQRKYLNPKSDEVKVGKNDIFFNEDALYVYDEIKLVEGAFDSLSVGNDSVATSGWSFSHIQVDKILKSPVKRLVFIPDAGYYNQTLKQASRFVNYKDTSIVDIRKIPEWSDVTAFGYKRLMTYYSELKQQVNFNLLYA
jgi:hypothetical protein